MPQPLPEQLRELEADVRDLRFAPAADVRARGRKRGRRQLAALTVAGAVVVTTAGIALTGPGPDTTLPVAAGRPTVTCDLTLPDGPSDVRLRVLDGGAPTGRLAATVTDLRARDFTVVNGPATPASTTVLRYGPAAIGKAALLRAELLGEVTTQFDPGRGDETIDVILGPGFTRLATPTEINQNLVAAGRPTAPPGC